MARFERIVVETAANCDHNVQEIFIFFDEVGTPPFCSGAGVCYFLALCSACAIHGRFTVCSIRRCCREGNRKCQCSKRLGDAERARAPRVLIRLARASSLIASLVLAPLAAYALPVQQINLVTDDQSINTAQILTDPTLKNAWGIAMSPTSPFWVSSNGSDLARYIASTLQRT